MMNMNDPMQQLRMAAMAIMVPLFNEMLTRKIESTGDVKFAAYVTRNYDTLFKRCVEARNLDIIDTFYTEFNKEQINGLKSSFAE